MEKDPVVIVGLSRTPMGGLMGDLGGFSANELGAVAVTPALSFNDLKKLLRITDGNLSVHARRLEEAGYLECLKSFEGRVPRTEYRLTTAGKRALQGYLDHMEALIRATRAR